MFYPYLPRNEPDCGFQACVPSRTAPRSDKFVTAGGSEAKTRDVPQQWREEYP